MRFLFFKAVILAMAGDKAFILAAIATTKLALSPRENKLYTLSIKIFILLHQQVQEGVACHYSKKSLARWE
ncbi:hypothetical protein Dd703_2043 [Musicola paradisiaca Ech703]|uniref:Uncharacterized protein n=1 Tax=Musicola paradisiaca (strain Ech703) TaxID=579405 RepID=C6C6T8_MUSP7|nr:hypothetical protein Dd703_2043 [Musicola paradisiaca Ech703]